MSKAKQKHTRNREIWKPVLGFEGLYEVSNLGRVKSLKRRAWNGKGWHVLPERFIQGRTNSKGYYRVGLVGVDKFVHCLVLEAFVGPCPTKEQCRHLDGDPTNNQLTNLEWATPAKNQADKVIHGTHNRGEAHSESRLTEKQVYKIRASKELQRVLAERYGVCAQYISAIKHRLAWRHI